MPEGEFGSAMAQRKVPSFKRLFESAVRLADAMGTRGASGGSRPVRTAER